MLVVLDIYSETSILLYFVTSLVGLKWEPSQNENQHKVGEFSPFIVTSAMVKMALKSALRFQCLYTIYTDGA